MKRKYKYGEVYKCRSIGYEFHDRDPRTMPVGNSDTAICWGLYLGHNEERGHIFLVEDEYGWFRLFRENGADSKKGIVNLVEGIIVGEEFETISKKTLSKLEKANEDGVRLVA
jgi:hypothetical protein